MAREKDVSESLDFLAELQDIKRLLVLALASNGVKQDNIAAALQISQPTVSRMLPKGLKAPKKPQRENS